MTFAPLDAVSLTSQLVQCPSVTPKEAGALALLDDLLTASGFECTRVDRNGTPNLFARWGHKGANRSFGFNGHTDVVPTGDPALWDRGPFSGDVDAGRVWGRGACDMKSGVAAFVAAAIDFVTLTPPDGAVILTITGDEEGPAKDGTVALLDWMTAHGEQMTHCLVGEPTCPSAMGEMIKNGRRGSMNVRIIARGSQGHAAYPHKARNPLPALVKLATHLAEYELDTGSACFDPSTLALTSIDTGNEASNVIPAQASAKLNIRFNDLHSGESLTAWLRQELEQAQAQSGIEFDLSLSVSGESFVTDPGWFTDILREAVEDTCGMAPVLSTSGGTSDARFIRSHCPVIEFGLVGTSMHQTNEYAEVEHIHQLKSVYSRLLERYFEDQTPATPIQSD